jgi:hypothetical protein
MATWAVARSWAVDSPGMARTVQPFDDLGWVEANKVTDFEIGHTALGHEPADAAHRVTQEVREGLDVY